MMALLRSRTAMYVLVGLTVLGLVATGAVGLFNALSAPAPAEGPGAGQGAATPDVPALDTLGSAPDGFVYSDLGPQCDPGTGECFRAVGVTAADDADGAATVEAVYGHLIDRGWGRMLPKGAKDPDDVPLEDTVLTKDDLVVKGSVEPYDKETTAGLIIADAKGAGQ
ncbi:hypothetical protein CLV63_103218 [Murinocardiopsis flavida]|uniref:Uncharacterized protein n=1 Tax=Murinocardiopsis flavida TaxID=645275 RepID=A0A2P8DQK1_9ACTN|nr:hypothetical protein [Murinocardiopsis flavida]PSK99493.1 hypothetical protein CLV63_103218 [Murinocardiopsis flavida]